MLDNYSSKAIVTKVRAMYGKRLLSHDYEELLRKKTVSDAALYLKNHTDYTDVLMKLNDEDIHRGQVEQLIREDLFNKYTRLCRYSFSGKQDGIYRCYVFRAEINEILRCVMMLNAGTAEEFIIALPDFLAEQASFNLYGLARVRSFDDLLHVLHGTGYDKILQACRPDFGLQQEESTIDYLRCEYSLYAYYYETLFKVIKRDFKGKSRKELNDLFHLEAEIINLRTATRLKKYFNKSPSFIKQYLFPYFYRLTPKKWDQLLKQGGLSGGEKRSLEILTEDSDRQIVAQYGYIEHYTQTLRYQLSRKIIRASTHAAVSLYAFLVLCEIELENIINIIEGIRYGVMPEEIKKLLIF